MPRNVAVEFALGANVAKTVRDATVIHCLTASLASVTVGLANVWTTFLRLEMHQNAVVEFALGASVAKTARDAKAIHCLIAFLASVTA
jgi:hypothetical protein